MRMRWIHVQRDSLESNQHCRVSIVDPTTDGNLTQPSTIISTPHSYPPNLAHVIVVLTIMRLSNCNACDWRLSLLYVRRVRLACVASYRSCDRSHHRDGVY